jgi:acyl phosphate:glycerol-3-phosphate acyltransferase
MDWQLHLIAFVLCYLIGSVTFTRVVPKILRPNETFVNPEVTVEGTDLTYKVGSYGAAAASMQFGPRIGLLISLGDILKVTIPVLVFRWMYPQDTYLLSAAIGGMTGHIWPIFFKFKGGRGISAYYGGLFAIDPIGAVITMMGGMFLGFAIIKDFFVAYLAGLWLLLPWIWFTTYRWEYVLYAVIVNVLVILAMLPDLNQYMKIKKEVHVDSKMVLETTPMGRGMIKMSKWFENVGKKKD